MFVPAILLNNSAVRCISVPLPPCAMDSGLAGLFGLRDDVAQGLAVNCVDAARMKGEAARLVIGRKVLARVVGHRLHAGIGAERTRAAWSDRVAVGRRLRGPRRWRSCRPRPAGCR